MCSCARRASPFNFIFSQVCKKVDVINDSIYFFYVLFVCPLFVKGSPHLLFPILLAPPRPVIEGGVLLYLVDIPCCTSFKINFCDIFYSGELIYGTEAWIDIKLYRGGGILLIFLLDRRLGSGLFGSKIFK